MAARIFGLGIFAAKPSKDVLPWSADRPMDIPRPADLHDFCYPPESSFSDTDRAKLLDAD